MLTRDEILLIDRVGPDAVVALIESLLETQERMRQEITALKADVAALRAQLSQDSHNSHKPPSSDGPGRRRTKSRRRASGKKPGGQKGHAGQTLRWSAQPDALYEHRAAQCGTCGSALSGAPADAVHYVERRQVTDLPVVRPLVSESHVVHQTCPICRAHAAGPFPAGVTQPVQHGLRVRAWSLYLLDYQLWPRGRSLELLHDLVGVSVAAGTLETWQAWGATRWLPISEALRTALRHAPNVHFDETGWRVAHTLKWVHVASTAQLTYSFVHARRGRVAMDAMGILPEFRGRTLHDAWKPYAHYGCAHSLCNGHHLRELTAVQELTGQAWPAELAQLLAQIKDRVAAA